MGLERPQDGLGTRAQEATQSKTESGTHRRPLSPSFALSQMQGKQRQNSIVIVALQLAAEISSTGLSPVRRCPWVFGSCHLTLGFGFTCLPGHTTSGLPKYRYSPVLLVGWGLRYRSL